MCYAKVILNVYPQIDRVIKDMDKLVLSRCLASFNDRLPCEMGIKEVYKLMETKQKLMLDTLMDEEDISLMEENISEILGNSVD